MDLLTEIPWIQFSQLPEISRLPLREQQMRYNVYLDELCLYKFNNWLRCQDRGGRSDEPKKIVSEGFLQQEDLYYILQEDGSKIYVTIEI